MPSFAWATLQAFRVGMRAQMRRATRTEPSPPRQNGRDPLADGRKHFGRATPAKLRNPRATLHLQRQLKKRKFHVWWKGETKAAECRDGL